MEEKKISNRRYNKHKTETNELKSSIGRCLSGIKEINATYMTMPNVVETYQDKIYEIYDNLYREDIDFWGNHFPLREAVITDLKAHMQVGTYLIKETIEIAISFPDLIIASNFLNNRNMRRLSPLVAKINELNNYIQDYSIEEKLDTSLLNYFSNLEFSSLVTPDKVKKMYRSMKKCAENMGLKEKFMEAEPEILKIIETKEDEWNKKIDDEYEKLLKIFQSITEEPEERTNHIR